MTKSRIIYQTIFMLCVLGCSMSDDHEQQQLVADVTYSGQIADSHTTYYQGFRDGAEYWLDRERVAYIDNCKGNDFNFTQAKIAMAEAQQIVSYLSIDIWTDDGVPVWQTTDETLDIRSGDCEAIATLAQRLLIESGGSADSVFVGMFVCKKGSHATLCYMPNGERSTFIGIDMPLGYDLIPVAGVNCFGYWEYPENASTS